MWDDHQHYQTMIKASIAANKPPCAVIFNDAAHDWCPWDFKLLKAYFFLENMMQGEWPIWIADSDRVVWDVTKKTSRPQAAIDRAKHTEQKRMDKKGATPHFGLQLIAKPRTNDGGPMPVLDDWLKQREEKEGRKQK